MQTGASTPSESQEKESKEEPSTLCKQQFINVYRDGEKMFQKLRNNYQSYLDEFKKLSDWQKISSFAGLDFWRNVRRGKGKLSKTEEELCQLYLILLDKIMQEERMLMQSKSNLTMLAEISQSIAKGLSKRFFCVTTIFSCFRASQTSLNSVSKQKHDKKGAQSFQEIDQELKHLHLQ